MVLSKGEQNMVRLSELKPHFAAEKHGTQRLGALGYTAANRC